ncbi:MAG TPA: hypothetical protein VG722_00330, partial [Tepidisphaeraceae bacterium]|nr:hypothetical protein [Tepidisphaeraceae bacterium]
MDSPNNQISTDIAGKIYHSWRTHWKDKYVHPYSSRYWNECLAVDKMSRDQLLELQRTRLQELVDEVVQHVPFYRTWAQSSGYQPGDSIDINDLPIVSKDDYVADMEAFQSDAYSLDEMGRAKTSGSSGEPFSFRLHPAPIDYSYCCLWRGLHWHGLGIGDRRVYVWGQSWQWVTFGWRRILKRAKLGFRNWLNNTLFVNAYRLSEANVARAFEDIQRFRPVYIHGYVSAIYMIAAYMQANNKRFDFPLKAVVLESEKLYDFQRQAMDAAFNCSIVENYGSVEFGMIAAQDPEGRMRIHDDMHWVEQMPGTNEAVITKLRGRAYPFIRYRLGDIIELSPTIPAGRPYSVLNKVMGRTVDLIPLVGGGFMPGVS